MEERWKGEGKDEGLLERGMEGRMERGMEGRTKWMERRKRGEKT